VASRRERIRMSEDELRRFLGEQEIVSWDHAKLGSLY
jgi:hypothetical protein